MSRPIDIPEIREQLQEMFRDAFQPKSAAIGHLIATLSEHPVKIIHLGPDGGNRGDCGMETSEDHISSEHNDITCPLCYAYHEAICAKGDDESDYFEWDVDSILETDEFMDECVRALIQRLASKGDQP